MAKTDQDDEFYLANDRVLAFSVVDEDVSPEVALDLTGATIRWAMSLVDPNSGLASPNPTLEKSTATGGVTITDAENGEVEVAIADTDTDSLPPGEYYHELETVDASGNVTVVATGTITLLQNLVNS